MNQRISLRRDPPASAQTTAPGATLADGELIDALRRGGYVSYFRHAATNPDQADTSDPKLGQEATGIWPKREGDAHVFRPRPDGGFDYMGEIVVETRKRRASGAAQAPRLGDGN